MKYIWKCKCEIYPNKEKILIFNSFDKVNQYVRNRISEYVNIRSYIKKVKSYGNYKCFQARAEFLTQYITDPSFPHSEADLPPDKLEDYDDYDTYFEESEDLDEDLYTEDFFDKFYDPCLSKELLDLRDVGVDFMSEFVLPDSDTFEPLKVSFKGLLDITVKKRVDWEPSLYPIMVLKVLQDTDEPLRQEEISEKIMWRFFDCDDSEEGFQKTVHRNIIGRIIKMLKDLGFTITRSKEGYLLDKSGINESPTIKEDSFGTKANSVMILCVLQSADAPLTKGEIVEKIKNRFHHTIDVKTVGRNVKLLQDNFKYLKYEIKKSGNKGYLLQK